MGGTFSDIEPLLSANGPQDLIDQLSTLGTLGSQNSVALDRFKVAEEEARKAKKIADDADSYQYLAESIRMHPDQETLKAMMQDAGLDRVEYFNLTAGVAALHVGVKF
jgi:hypothetical protein